MRIISKTMLADFWRKYPQAKPGLTYWHWIVKTARWRSFSDVRAMFPHADQVTVRSGRRVVVFNIGGNKYRLITAVHYDRERVYTLMVLSHKEYSEENWKDVL